MSCSSILQLRHLMLPYLASRSLRFSPSIQSWRVTLITHRPRSMLADIDHHPKLMATQAASQSSETPAPTVEIIGQNGQKIIRKINPSYPNKPKAITNLLKNLFKIHLVQGPSGTAYNSRGWELDTAGNMISRLASFDSEQTLKQAQIEIDAAASELHHHPTVFVGTTDDTRIPYMLIACTTHSPPGLSVKDAKLAQKVDEILENIKEQDNSDDKVLNAEELSARRQEAWAHVKRELAEDCGCASGHTGKSG